MKYTCPCCGYKTLNKKPPGTFQVCKICFWEDDKIQFEDPDNQNGSNEISLNAARVNFLLFGACRERFIQHVKKPTENDIRDPERKHLG